MTNKYQAFTEKMNAYLDDYHKNNLFAGIIRVHIADEPIIERDFGMADFENNIPFSRKSAFSYYSISKPFCALGLMKLWDRGLVNLDAHPGKYVPEAEGLDSRITIRQLLTHTSGVQDFERTEPFASSRSGESSTLREALREISSFPLLFEPGTSSYYANVNFIIPSMIIENLTDEDYGEYMKREVFEPLGMNGAHIDFDGLVLKNRVQGYELKDCKTVPIDRSLDWLRGAGDVVATADDLYCLNHAIKKKRLVSESAWREILTPSPVSRMGLGCSIDEILGYDIIRHNGGHHGFRTLHIQIPDYDFDMILLSNFGFGSAREDIWGETARLLFDGVTAKKAEMDKGYI